MVSRSEGCPARDERVTASGEVFGQLYGLMPPIKVSKYLMVEALSRMFWGLMELAITGDAFLGNGHLAGEAEGHSQQGQRVRSPPLGSQSTEPTS